MKKNKPMIIFFLAPAVLSFVFMFLYPVIRTTIMSFFKVESVTGPVSSWAFLDIENYTFLFSNQVFLVSLLNILKIWLIGGVFVLSIALIFAVILTSGIRFKSFFRAAIYLPNIISAVALATMWMQYVFSTRYGLLKDIFTKLGMTSLANINWLSSDYKFWAMLIAFSFGAIGYYTLIFLSGIERIPADLFEAATIDGAGKWRQFFQITMPLLKGVVKTNLTFWSINTITFFVWSKMFSPVSSDKSTVTPIVYMYNTVFGTMGSTDRNAGRGAAVGVILTLFVIVAFFLFGKLIKEEEVEF